MAAKSSSAFNSLGGRAVDFFNTDDDALDPFAPLHAKEAVLVANVRGVSRAALWLNIRFVFALPRVRESTDQVAEMIILLTLFTGWNLSPSQARKT